MRFPIALCAAAALYPMGAQAVWDMTPEGYMAHIYASAELCRERMPKAVEEGLKFIDAKVRSKNLDIAAMKQTEAYKKEYAASIAELSGKPEAERISACNFEWGPYSDKASKKK